MPFMGSKYAKIAFAAGALPRTPLGELTALPRPLAGLKGPISKGRGGEEEGGEGERRGGKGRVKSRPLSQIPGSAPVVEHLSVAD